MASEWEKQEGILLQAIPYLEIHRILKVFTPDGLISLMAKHVKATAAAHTVPFCRAEWVYRKTQTEIQSIKDATLIDPLSALRKNSETLFAAGSIASDLLRSQFPHRPSQELYNLLLAYLQNLPRNPVAIAQSFRLKLLQFEGLLRLDSICSRCATNTTHLSGGEGFCSQHAPIGSVPFNDEEWHNLLTLGLGRRFSEFESIHLQPSSIEKITLLFSVLTK